MSQSSTSALKKVCTKETLSASFFILPSLLGFIVFFALPLIRGVWISFTDWDLFNPPAFIGVQNFVALFKDDVFWNSLWVTIQYVLWNIPLQTVLALLIAVVMTKIKTSSLLRGTLLLPWLLPNVVVALLGMVLLDPAIGIINEGLKYCGFGTVNFLTTVQLALPSIAFINIWKFMGYNALIVFAGIQGIPQEVNEAVIMDGAPPWKAFWAVTFPMIRNVMAFVITTSVIGSFQIYDTVAVATRGGPGHATWVMNFFITKTAFEEYKMGLGTAAALVLFLILVAVGFIQMRLMRADESD